MLIINGLKLQRIFTKKGKNRYSFICLIFSFESCCPLTPMMRGLNLNNVKIYLHMEKLMLVFPNDDLVSSCNYFKYFHKTVKYTLLVQEFESIVIWFGRFILGWMILIGIPDRETRKNGMIIGRMFGLIWTFTFFLLHLAFYFLLKSFKKSIFGFLI